MSKCLITVDIPDAFHMGFGSQASIWPGCMFTLKTSLKATKPRLFIEDGRVRGEIMSKHDLSLVFGQILQLRIAGAEHVTSLPLHHAAASGHL